MNAKVTIALAAALGGASPNLLRLAHDLSEKNGDKFSYLGSTFFTGLLLYAALGAGVALIWGEKSRKRAFYLGLGLPSLVQVALVNATQPTSPGPPPAQAAQVEASPPSTSSFSLFSSPAFAEPFQLREGDNNIPAQPASPTRAPAPAATPNNAVETRRARQLTLVLEDVPKGAELWFTSGGKRLSPVILDKSSTSDEGSRVDLQVPDLATGAFLRIGTSQSSSLPIKSQEGSTTAFRVDVDHDHLGGFLRALGVQDVNLLNFEIHRLKEPPRP